MLHKAPAPCSATDREVFFSTNGCGGLLIQLVFFLGTSAARLFPSFFKTATHYRCGAGKRDSTFDPFLTRHLSRVRIAHHLVNIRNPHAHGVAGEFEMGQFDSLFIDFEDTDGRKHVWEYEVLGFFNKKTMLSGLCVCSLKTLVSLELF